MYNILSHTATQPPQYLYAAWPQASAHSGPAGHKPTGPQAHRAMTIPSKTKENHRKSMKT